MTTASPRVEVIPDPRDLPGPFVHRIAVPVRVADTDTFDHVNNAVYLTYFEIGRVEYLVAATGKGLPVPAFGGRISFILAEARVTFRSPAIFGEVLTIETRVTRIRRTSLTMDHRITAPAATQDPGAGGPAPLARLVAVGETVLIRYDYDKSAPTSFETDLVAAIEAYEAKHLRD